MSLLSRLSPKMFPSTSPSQDPRVKACSLRHRPGIPHKPLQRDIDVLVVTASTNLCRPPPLLLGTWNWTTPCHVRHTAVHLSRCRLSLSTLAPAAEASCHQALHHHHATKTRGRPAFAILVSCTALPAHLVGPLDASLYSCGLKRPNKIHRLHGADPVREG